MPSFRGEILIHVSKGCKRAEYVAAAAFIKQAGGIDVPPLKAMPAPGFQGRARVIDVQFNGGRGHSFDNVRGGQCKNGCGYWTSGPIFSELVPACSKPDPWAIQGAVGLVLDEVVEFPVFVPWPGSLGFFNVDPHEFALLGASAMAGRPRTFDELCERGLADYLRRPALPKERDVSLFIEAMRRLIDRKALVKHGLRLEIPKESSR